MDEREKIIETLRASGYGYFITHDGANAEEALRQTADALIEAGIGDVTAHETETEYWKTICKTESDEHHTAIKNAAEHARRLMQERDEYKRRAEVAEKEREEYRKSTRIALRGIEILKRNCLRVFCTDFPSILQQAEREIEEEKGK